MVLQVVMKGSLDYLWSLFLMLQLIRSLTMYQMATPSNVEVYLDMIKSFVDFEMLKPDFFISLIYDEELTLVEFIQRLKGEKAS